MTFSKSDLIAHVVSEASLSKDQAQHAVEAVLSGITQALAAGKEARFIGFGVFSVQKSEARQGRNPRTGDAIQIAASKRPVFKAGKEFKDAVNV